MRYFRCLSTSGMKTDVFNQREKESERERERMRGSVCLSMCNTRHIQYNAYLAFPSKFPIGSRGHVAQNMS